MNHQFQLRFVRCLNHKAFTLSAGDNDGVAELTETSLGYGVKGGSNEVDVTNGEFIQVDFAASVTQVSLELDSLAGNYNVGSNANAEIRVVLFKDGTEVDTLIFDPDEENGALLISQTERQRFPSINLLDSTHSKSTPMTVMIIRPR